MEVFAKRLKEERITQGWTQKEFAEKLGIPFRTYTNYEQIRKGFREPGFEMLIKMAKELDVTTDYLLGLQD